jgi:hypothetical protein
VNLRHSRSTAARLFEPYNRLIRARRRP